MSARRRYAATWPLPVAAWSAFPWLRRLPSLPLDVVVIEPVAADADEQPSFDSRTTALSSGSRRVLEGIGAWSAIAGQATPIRRIHVSERGVFGTATLTAEEQGVPSLGYTIENRFAGKALRERVAAFPRLQVRNARVAGLEPGKDVVRLRTDAGEIHEARLVVAADGAQSAVRTALGIEASVSDYGQHAIIAHVDTTRFHDYTAYERFTPDGPLAVLPIGEGRSAVVWTLAPEAARRVLALDDPAFLAELQEAFGLRLGRFTRVGRRQSYPLALTRAERLTAPPRRDPRQCRAGPASRRRPGFQSRAPRRRNDCGADCRTRIGGDPGAARSSSDMPHGAGRTVTRSSASPIRWSADSACRSHRLSACAGGGLLLFDLLRPVKHEFARRTMGLAGRQPRLVRGLPLLRARRWRPPASRHETRFRRAGRRRCDGRRRDGSAPCGDARDGPASHRARRAAAGNRPGTRRAARPARVRAARAPRSSSSSLPAPGRPSLRALAAYQRMVVWEERTDPGGADALVFDAAELGEPDLGHIGENRSIQAALISRAEALGVVLLRADFATLESTRDAVRVGLGDGREFRAGLVVGADGADSAVRRQAGIDIRGWDYGQRAVVAHLSPAMPHAETAWQRFLDTGPLALLPLADGRVSLVWSTLPEHAEELVNCAEADFASA